MSSENDALSARVKAVLTGADGVPDPHPDEARAILDSERAQVLHAIQTLRFRHRIASVHAATPGTTARLAEIEDIIGKNIQTLDAIDAELAKIPGTK